MKKDVHISVCEIDDPMAGNFVVDLNGILMYLVCTSVIKWEQVFFKKELYRVYLIAACKD